MKKIILALSLLLSLESFTQYNSRYTEYGLDRVKYNNIVRNLEPVFQKNPSRFAAIDLAEAFFYLRKLEKALMYFEIALLEGPMNEFHTKNYFLALYENGDRDIARKVANEFAVRFQKGELIAQMDSVESWKLQEPVYFEKNSVANTASNEYGLLTFYDNYKILNTDFTYDRYATVRNYAPYVINYEDTIGGRIKYIPVVPNSNSKYDIISHYDMELDKVYVTRTEPGISGTSRSRILIGTIDNNFNLMDVQEFKYNDLTYSVGHPCVSQDGEMLYFVSDKPGGFGGADIYRCMKLEDGTWGFPINLGPNVNTDRDELYPYVSPYGTTLYFSSNGRTIFGGLDINKSEKTRSHSFLKAENMGLPFNSDKDDFGMIFSDDYGTEGFFASNRAGGRGGDDVYSFSYENNLVCRDPVKNFEIIVVDKKTRARVANTNLKMTVKLDGRIYEDVSDENGEVHLLVEGCNDFDVEATHDFYLNNEFYYDGFRKRVVIELIKKELNNIIGLEKIFYDVAKFEVPSASLSQMNKLATLLKKNTDVTVELSSHTDSRGDDEFNQKLSQKRADHIVNHLIGLGVSRSQLIAQGYGESKLTNECGNESQCTEEDHEKNRRTEFKILEIRR